LGLDTLKPARRPASQLRDLKREVGKTSALQVILFLAPSGALTFAVPLTTPIRSSCKFPCKKIAGAERLLQGLQFFCTPCKSFAPPAKFFQGVQKNCRGMTSEILEVLYPCKKNAPPEKILQG
jgi:hypothetical protein